ncbi:oligosaccharide flippase family protein, partial [Paenibacillus sp. 598K]|uniref:oligosaccharide flippase family protein n=1 Tax=Paenibacillus sp. 598K TaxID=1117987 RepID=UPI001624F79B
MRTKEGKRSLAAEGRELRGQSRSQSWLHGALWLSAAALLSKAIGTLQKIPLQNLAGDRVFGIYNAVYPFYQLLLFLATAGIPVAVSLLVAERRGAGDLAGMRGALRVGMLLLGVCGLAGGILMWAGAGIAAGWIGDGAAAGAIRAAAPALCVVPMMAALRGYFQGMQQMRPSAISQVVEQTVRVATMLLLLYVGLAWGWSEDRLATGALIGSAAGGAAGLLTMLLFWRRAAREQPALRRDRADSGESAGLLRRMLALAVPVALGSIALPVAGIVDAFTIPRLLQSGDMVAAQAMGLFGQYSRAQPLVQLVVMVAG